jgi:RimJ/RimL family protein N-acetyltransferase
MVSISKKSVIPEQIRRASFTFSLASIQRNSLSKDPYRQFYRELVMTVDTPRLTLMTLTLEQLALHVANDQRLEQSLGLRKGHRAVVEPVLSVITHFTIPRLRDPKNDPLFHTMWIAIDKQTEQIVAEAKFKGEPDETGTVEIGYGTYPAYQRKGYMTEMVSAMVEWAGQQPDVWRVVADTEAENVASQKVLEKNNFQLFDRIEDMLWWQRLFD